MKLSKRFLFAPLVLAIFLYLFLTAYKSVKDRALSEFNSQQLILAKQASRGIESFFIYYQRELQFLSKLDLITELGEPGKKVLADFYNNHSDQIEAITVVDSKGDLIYTFPYNKTVIGQNISNQEHVKSIIETHQPIVSDVFSAIQGFKAIAYHVPIMVGNEYRGSLAILIPLDRLGKFFIENIRTCETGYGLLISEDGIELFNPISGGSGKSVKETYSRFPTVLNLIDRTLKEKEGTAICYITPYGQSDKKMSRTIASFFRVSLNNTFWTIMILTPEKEVFATLDSFRNRLYVIFILILIVIFTYFYLAFKATSVLKEEKKRKAVEKILQVSEKRFRTIFELSPAGIILIDEEGTIIEVNTSFCENLGYSRDELISKNIRLFTSPDREDEVKENIDDILTGKTMKHEVSNIRKDGTVCEVALFETMILLPDGKPGILSVSNDITEKKRSQEKMLTFSRALESIGECVSITDLQNRILFVNSAFCKTYGYSEGELLGKNIRVLRLSKSDGKIGEKILSDTINGGWNGELINIKKDGSEFPIELSTSVIKDEKGGTVALIGIAVDITDRKKAQKELILSKEKAEESDRLKSAFLANMSHELRTPLNAIVGFSSLMVESGKDPETITDSKIILESGQHLLSLVEDILNISMIEIGQVKINFTKTGIHSALNEVRNIVLGERLKEGKNNIEIILNLDNEKTELQIFTDVRKLKQVLINLLKNSLKFTDKGFIEFGYSRIDQAGTEYLKFFVKDTGIGIDKKYHKAIFNIFRQVDDSQTRKYGGTGIGLTIAKKIVEMLNGEIWVESEQGKGSVFYFTIPLLTEARQAEIGDFDTLHNCIG